MKRKKLEFTTPIKFFESVTTWVLGISLLTGLILCFKSITTLFELKKNTNFNYNFMDLVLELLKMKKDLNAIESLAQIYRIFILLEIILLSLFLVFRVITHEGEKIMKFSTIIFTSSIIFSAYLMFLSKDLFYAIRSINDRIYSTEFSKAMYLMQKMQNIKNLKYVIAYIFIATMTLTFLALMINLYESLVPRDTLLYKKMNMSFLVVIILSIIGNSLYNYKVFKDENIIKAKDYFILSYDIDRKNNVLPVPKINYKKIEKKYIDPYLRDFLETGLVFDIKKEDIVNEKNKNMKIITSYDVERATELDLLLKDLAFFVKSDDKVEVLRDINQLEKESLFRLLAKYDTRYLVKKDSTDKDDNTGIYYNLDRNKNIELTLVQLVDVNYIPPKFREELGENVENIYKIIYLGNIFVSNEDGKALAYTGMNNMSGVIYKLNSDELIKFMNEFKLTKY